MIKKIVFLAGPRPQYGFCTVPPLTDSAPERNLYRLTENILDPALEPHTISACGQTQLQQLRQIKSVGRYHWVAFPDTSLRTGSSKIIKNWLISGFCRRFLQAPDLFTCIYLERACRRIRQIAPDLILINGLPQYIRFVRRRFPNTRLGLFVRGEMGESRNYLPQLDLIITNSDGIADYVRTLLGGAKLSVFTIPNTLEETFSNLREPVPEHNGKCIIYTGRIEPIKGVWELLHAFARVQTTVPDARLLIVGGNFGKPALTVYEQKLVNYATGCALNVEFVGQIPNARLPAYYMQADLAVFPSICIESFGMVALEAMRCGLPVVASRRPGFEELVVSGETGLLVDDPTDTEALAQAMLDVLSDSRRASSMAKAGYYRSLQFTPAAAAQQFHAMIDSLL